MKWLLTIFGLSSLAAAILAGFYQYDWTIPAIGFLGFCILLFLANLDRISEFKASFTGFSAKTRELGKLLTQAETTLTELQSLALIVTRATLSLTKRSGRLGGYSDEEEEQIKKDMLAILTEIKIPESRQVEVLQDWHKFGKFDYALAILGTSTIPIGFEGTDIQQEWKALREIGNIPNPSQLRDFLKKWELLTPDREEWVKDYEHYIKNEEHRRPEEWKKRRSLEGLRKK